MTVTNVIFDPAPVPAAAPTEPPEPPMLLRPLSPRESQIVQMLDQGRTPKEVAFELGIANATVRVLLSRAVKKGSRPRRVTR
ncbi:MAG TPA: LuxR C-terminal-related transcriptional regulator [Polyangia bacterium]|nr:LuxR C-terminal-related transcriptional regulator [Polyangia bacterium]